jgi:hypothetical protein
MAMRDFWEYVGALATVAVFALVVYAFNEGPAKVAYEFGHTLSAFRTGFTEGGGVGAANLNQVFQDKK